jgi:hypothetical protein
MRCKDIFVLDVWIEVYVTPFLYACYDQTSMLELMRGMCALVRVIFIENLGK